MASQEEILASQEETPAGQEDTPARQEETPSRQEETPASQEVSPVNQEETPACQEETSASHAETPASQEGAADSHEETLWGASAALCCLGRHGQWIRNVLGKLRVHGESWRMLENLWVGSGMDGEVWRRFGECTGDAFERHVEAWVFVP